MKTIITSALIIFAVAITAKGYATNVFLGFGNSIAVADTLYLNNEYPKEAITRMNAESKSKVVNTRKLLSDAPVSDSKNSLNHLGSGILVAPADKKFVHRANSVY